jgi:hypothetical protein
MAGLTTFAGGDERYYNNIFVGDGSKTDSVLRGYNNVKLPMSIDGNIYYNKAIASKGDVNSVNSSMYNPELKIVEEGNNVYLHLTLDEAYFNHKVKMINTVVLGKAAIPKARFDNPDGSPLTIDIDYLGNKRSDDTNFAGPISNLETGKIVLKVW